MEVISVLGEGSCASVRLCCAHVAGNKIYTAVKSSNDSSSIAALKQEKIFLDVFSGHRHIVQCYGDYSWYDSFDGAADLMISGSDQVDGIKKPREPSAYGIYLEYVPSGSLACIIRRGRGLPELQVRRYAKSILKGLEIIHVMGYVHCDVKPMNILVAGSEEVKIADFDTAKKSGEQVHEGLLRGTLLYMAPECAARAHYEPPADVWSFGCTVLEMLKGLPPRKFPAGMAFEAKVGLIAGNNVRPEIPEEVSPVAKDFLRRCLAEDPERRWTVKMLLGHPFITMAAADGIISSSSSSYSSSSSSSSMNITSDDHYIKQAEFRHNTQAPAARSFASTYDEWLLEFLN